MGIKTFKCGLCEQRKKDFRSTREGLRKHLREEHRIMTEITNTITKEGKVKQNWWLAIEN